MIKDITHKELVDIIRAVNNAYYTDGGISGVNRYLSTINISSNMSITEMIAYVRVSALFGREKMPHHSRLLREIQYELRRRGETKERISKLLTGLI